jgi:hypothetical protein
MSESSKAYQWYEANATEVAIRHEALDPGKGLRLVAGKNHGVIVVEPVTAMIREGIRRRPNPGFRWIEDELLALHKTSRLGIFFDLILLNTVWMHVKPADRSRAFRKVIQLLKPGGAFVMTFR